MTAGVAETELLGIPSLDGRQLVAAFGTAQHELDRLIGLAHLIVSARNLVEVRDPVEDVIAAIERARLELVGLIS